MKTLYLLRHAKSSWDDAKLADFDRPLNERGRTAAAFMGALMRSRGYVPDVILSSTAVRALQTTAIVSDAAKFEGKSLLEPQIYEASTGRLIQIVSEIADQYRSALLIGHNPGFESLAAWLTGSFESMPTAALAVITLKIERWSELDGSCGKLVEIVRPKELMEPSS